MGFTYLEDILTMQTWDEKELEEIEKEPVFAIFYEILCEVWENVRSKQREKQKKLINKVFK